MNNSPIQVNVKPAVGIRHGMRPESDLTPTIIFSSPCKANLLSRIRALTLETERESSKTISSLLLLHGLLPSILAQLLALTGGKVAALLGAGEALQGVSLH